MPGACGRRTGRRTPSRCRRTPPGHGDPRSSRAGRCCPCDTSRGPFRAYAQRRARCRWPPPTAGWPARCRPGALRRRASAGPHRRPRVPARSGPGTQRLTGSGRRTRCSDRNGARDRGDAAASRHPRKTKKSTRDAGSTRRTRFDARAHEGLEPATRTDAGLPLAALTPASASANAVTHTRYLLERIDISISSFAARPRRRRTERPPHTSRKRPCSSSGRLPSLADAPRRKAAVGCPHAGTICVPDALERDERPHDAARRGPRPGCDPDGRLTQTRWIRTRVRGHGGRREHMPFR